jgi:peptidoglycan hydrolase-like protein with peptidoglycan-binding domain
MRTVVVVGIVASVGGFALVASAREDHTEQTAPVTPPVAVDGAAAPAAIVNTDAAESAPTTAETDTESLPDLAIVEIETQLTEGCTIEPKTITVETDSAQIQCLQQALAREGFYNGEPTGQFDFATSAAVEELQIERGLFVDGVAGRETGLELGIWPEEKLEVVRTPPPPPGSMDSWGFPLSSVSSIGDDAPPLPENSGSGKRVVYERISQRVWAVDGDGNIVRSWLVSGSQYNNEIPGTYTVYSRSEQSTAWNGRAILPYMIRWLQTDIGHIGFHGIPRHVEDGSAYQTEDELGTRLSGGCQRQADPDARFLWQFAPEGTTVVVL